MKIQLKMTKMYFACFSLIAAVTFSAQAEGVNAQTMQPSIGPGNIMSVDGVQTSGKWKPMVQGLFDWTYQPLLVLQSSNKSIVSRPVPHMSTFHLMGGLGITDWLNLGLDIPVVLYQAPQDMTTGPGPVFPTTSFGVGDIRMVAKFRLLNNEEGGFGIAAVPQITFPSGNASSFRGSDAFEFEPVRLAFEYRRKEGMFIALNASFLFRSRDQNYLGTRISHQFRYGIGGYLPLLKGTGVFAELLGSVGVSNGVDMYAPLESSVGLRYIHKKTGIHINGGFSLRLLQSPGIGHRIFVGIGFLPVGSAKKDPLPPAPSDRDFDGVIDLEDACPDRPGLPQFQGCPDKDEDGIPDKDDACPEVFGLLQFQGCPDRDQDGIPDGQDLCPDEPGPMELQGCPDRDRDTVADKDDLCPEEPGLKELKGCPDKDLDGIPDRQDLCPSEAGPREFQGCPDKDADGIPDREDRCPEQAGPKPTGCPAVKRYISVTREKIELLQKILFATNKDTISPASFPLLNEVVSVMKERSTMRVLIEGHTDDRGDKDYNMMLSRNRAKSVLEYLATHGVERIRLQSEGYGPSRPIADNKTLAGQDKNRRTEFVILQQ